MKCKELGVKISDSTMNDWYAATCEKLNLDESTLPMIDNEKHRVL